MRPGAVIIAASSSSTKPAVTRNELKRISLRLKQGVLNLATSMKYHLKDSRKTSMTVPTAAIQTITTAAAAASTGGPPSSSTVVPGPPQTSSGVAAAAVAAVVPLVTATVLVPKPNQATVVPQSSLHAHPVQTVQAVQVVQAGQAGPGYYQVSGGPDSPQSGGSGGSGGTPVKASACPYCFKSFFDRSTMKRHMKRHFADRETYDCVACSKSFTRKDKLRDHLKSARHILTVFGPNALPAGNERPTEAAHSPSSASSPEHPGPSSDALSSLPQTEREIVRFMEKLRTMGKLEGLPMDAAGPLQQLATTGSVFNGNVIGANNGTMGVSDTEGDDQEDEAEGDAAPENNDDRVPESVESPPLSVSPANESS